MGLTLDLGMEKGNIACLKREARGRIPYPYSQRDASRAGLWR